MNTKGILLYIIKHKGTCPNIDHCHNCPIKRDTKMYLCDNDQASYDAAIDILYRIDPSLCFELTL